MTLLERQWLFARLLARLLDKAGELGFGVTLGECWRSTAMARLNQQHGTGTASSLHCERLAVDLNLFRGSEYLGGTEAHRPLGEWWEQQHPDCRWGGRFARADGNHYSLTPDHRG